MLARVDCVYRIWEGTVVVLALDLARAAKDTTALKGFIDVSNSIQRSQDRVLTR